MHIYYNDGVSRLNAAEQGMVFGLCRNQGTVFTRLKAALD